MDPEHWNKQRVGFWLGTQQILNLSSSFQQMCVLEKGDEPGGGAGVRPIRAGGPAEAPSG
jgi:hypothetical protein